MTRNAPRTLRAAVIGLGEWGQCHVETYAALPGVEVVAVCDAYAPRVQEISARYGIESGYTEAAPLWERDDIDLISVVTPENQHLGAVVNALRSGKNVLVEKAVATQVADAQAMMHVALETGRFLMPGHILRFDARYAEVARHLEQGSIGEVISLFSRRFRPQKQFANHGKNHTVFVQTVHDIDLVLWWADSRVKRVHAVERRLNPDLRVVSGTAPDVLWATLEFENGLVAVLHSSWLLPSAANVDMGDYAEVIGSRGVLRVQTSDNGFSWWSDAPENPGRHSPDLSIHHKFAGQITGALRAELSYFCDCIRRDEPPTHASFADAVHGVQIAQAIIESASNGWQVLL